MVDHLRAWQAESPLPNLQVYLLCVRLLCPLYTQLPGLCSSTWRQRKLMIAEWPSVPRYGTYLHKGIGGSLNPSVSLQGLWRLPTLYAHDKSSLLGYLPPF